MDLFHANKHLRSLSMKRCSQYTAETILFILNNLLDLESLNISGVLKVFN